MGEVMSVGKNKTGRCISGVNCQVENCQYHTTGNLCTAAGIDVKNETAHTKAETFCGTFTPVDSWQ